MPRLVQGELPFTPRGRRLDRRARGVNVRAFECRDKDGKLKPVICMASDSAKARIDYLTAAKAVDNITLKFTDIRAKRAPEHDNK